MSTAAADNAAPSAARHVFFRRELEAVASFCRIYRCDGVTLGFTTHDRDLWLDGIWHRAAPGMVPSAIRLGDALSDDGADIAGVLSHDSISEADLLLGRYDGARIEMGAVDWESGAAESLYSGIIGTISASGGEFTAELLSAKTMLEADTVPRTSPACRAKFCGHGCGLPINKYTREVVVEYADYQSNAVRFLGLSGAGGDDYIGGYIRWLSGPQAGLRSEVVAAINGAPVFAEPLAPGIKAGMRALLHEGCNHTLAECAARFGNAVNFQGEPFLPGNDLLARYPSAS